MRFSPRNRLIGEIMSTITCNSQVPSKKSRKIGSDESNCISDLPDWAICNILSRLPTFVAVRTSVLSKEWEFKWTSVYNIEIDDSIGTKNSKKAFVNFVERTLFFTHGVQSLRLSCFRKYDLQRMKTWLSVALSRDLHRLQIYFFEAGFDLPRNILNCSVRELDLNVSCTFKVREEICFLHLTTLRLVRVSISNELSMSDLVKFKFPVLETFELIGCKWLNVKFVKIYAPKMTSFESRPRNDDPGDYTIKITGDSPVRFKSRGILPGNIVLSGSTVVYASLETSYNIGYCDWGGYGNGDLRYIKKGGLQLQKLLAGFPGLKELALRGFVAMSDYYFVYDLRKAISQSKQKVSLPKYYNMERLVLNSVGDARTLIKLLCAAPSLKFLIMYLRGWNHYDYDKVDVPSSVVSELEEVKFVTFGEEMHEFKLAKFFIKNASQLKRVCVGVSYDSRIPKNEISEELSRYPTVT